MLITSILVSIWLNLFDKYHTFLFCIIFSFVFTIEIYIALVFISTYLSLTWFHRYNNSSIHYPLKFLWSYLANRSVSNQQNHSLLSNEYISEISNVSLQNPFRRLMLLKIHNLFRKTPFNTNKDSDNNNNKHKYRLFDYRCPICFNNTQSAFRWIALGCGHILCSLCTQHLYFGNKPMCPSCRSPIILADVTILYI
ncbi:unnamed protein product [Rotaria socialis]|uniref:RING-type domain-containing protein n=1 Tax=Rotaria socialis TaxID=392032 RepID=A0A819ZDF7_9BILA|nr:unnamed protein product [Rotaria socialis]CAF3487776.1 unnamed protein product [Rotaria socialis]CAF3637741.1 unnamed protein product [Rotaria socialis]CAF4172621.1 unnamed protein product [Rotaria socialis]CAF4232669.1 unnamed protein product [Rotaria socialis]